MTLSFDWFNAEMKNGNGCFPVQGRFNLIITSNCRLRVRLQGDIGAWRRRMLIVRYEAPAPAKKIPDFADVLIREEGSGILNWALEGLALLLADVDEIGDVRLTERQQAIVDSLLAESDSLRVFLGERVEHTEGEALTTTELVEGYAEYFMTTTIDGQTVEVGKPGWRGDEMTHEHWLPLSILLTKGPSSVTDVQVSAFYGEAWVLTHYLMSDPARYRQLFRQIKFHRARLHLLQVPALAEPRFTQAAAFLKVRDGDDPLDATWVHPESYSLARQLLAEAGFIDADLRDPEKQAKIKSKLGEVNPVDAAARLGSSEGVVRDVMLPDPDHRV